MEENTKKQRKNFDKCLANVDDPRYRKIRKKLLSQRPGKLLEVGCCGGEFLELVRNDGWDVCGLEISKEATGRANKRRLNVIVHDANRKFPFKNNVFDIVVAGEVIEHTTDDVGFLNECYRVLKDGGLLVVTTPNLISLKNRFLMLFGFNPRYVLGEYHYRFYTKRVFEDIVNKSMFKKFKFSGNFVVYSRNRGKVFGTIFEKWAEWNPSLAEHFIVWLEK